MNAFRATVTLALPTAHRHIDIAASAQRWATHCISMNTADITECSA
ncbi:MAG: hypothetical protein KME42_17990 [Tildeniella nuda ZEHNDER 1965/U140]|nr:hypothetical protein [Tildeniella nuda ZEHNDER 1965/U140]